MLCSILVSFVYLFMRFRVGPLVQ